MIFAIIVGVEKGPMNITCSSIEELIHKMANKLKQSDDVVHAVGMWALNARPGHWVDWENGWIFAVSELPTEIREHDLRH